MSLNMIDILIAVNKAVKKANAYTDSKTSGVAGGINYNGAVAYYDDLPANPEKGDAYTVKYAGSSGTIPDGTEYVWEFDTDLQAMAWIDWSKDSYTKAEADANLNAVTTALIAKIAKAAATYRGTYTTAEALNAASGDANDFAFLKTTDSDGNEIYSRYSRVEIPQVVPEGYTQLMYISSNGTQHIDTGVQAKRDLKTYIKFTRNSWGSGSFVGARTDSSRYELRFDNWSGRFYCEIGGAAVNIPSEMSSISEIVFEYPTVTVDDTVFNIPAQSDFTLEKNIYLCASNGNSSKGIISLYECIIYDDDKTTELKHFYPCKNSSNVCGMYETVEGVFYPDANGGNFDAGPQANGYWNFEYSIPGNLFSSTQFAAINSGINSTKVTQIETNKTNISSLSEQLSLAIAALTAEIAKVGATFKGIFTSQEALDAAAADENDVAILQTTDANGNVFYAINTYKEVEPAGNLPEGYTQLLYIQSNGTQYIDTGVNLSSSRGFYMKFMPLALENNTAFFGLHGFDNRHYSVNYKLEISNYDMYFRYLDQFRVDIAINEISEVDFKPRILSVNGTATTVTDEGEWYFSGTNTAALFAYKDDASFNGKSSMRLYECKMYDSDNTTLLRHFIPVRNSNNEVGLYDLVEGRFYGNEGTGSFTAGPSADGYWTANYVVMHSADGKQDVIDSSHKLSSDLVDDTAKTHKFATQEQLEQINTNKNNISTIGTNVAIADITNTIVAEEGYSILDYSRLYKQGKHVFGTIVIRKDSGYFSNVENIAIATIATANAPERVYLSAGNFSPDVWAVSNIGYAFVNSAQAITQPGIIKCKDNATTNNFIKLQVDYVTP
jgi:hypothetical protein